MFGSKGKYEIKEFETMRQSLRSSEKPAERSEGDRAEKAPSAEAPSPSVPLASNITVAPALAVRPADDSLLSHPDKCSSVVSTGSIWNGNLRIEGSVRVDGRLSGEIQAKGTVHVSKSAEVDAKVCAAYLVIAGNFRGQAICSERLEILPTGRVTGELTTKSLVVHEGSFLEGQLKMSDAQPSVAAAPTATAKGANGAAHPLAKPASVSPVVAPAQAESA